MTRDEIIEMAKQSGFSELEFFGTKVGTNVTICLEAFAKLVEERTAAKEREQCALICDAEWGTSDEQAAGVMFSKEIRARGEK